MIAIFELRVSYLIFASVPLKIKWNDKTFASDGSWSYVYDLDVIITYDIE